MPYVSSKKNRFTKPKKPMPLWLRLGILIASATVLGVGLYLGIQYFTSHLTVGPAQVNIAELWNDGKYDEIIDFAKEELKNHPLDSGSLMFSGFSYFQKAVAEEAVEKSLPLIDQSIFFLRKALLLPGNQDRPQIFYILGKAYYMKGKFYSDLSIRFLKRAEDLHFQATDIPEYLGLAYSRMGKYEEAVQYFKKTAEINPSDLIFGALGQTYLQINKYPEAIQFLSEAIAKTKDRAKEQQWRFLLGEIYTKNKDFDKANEQYNAILALNANSADAHFYLGEILLQQDRKDEARKEWIKAFKIDPLHFGANQRLFTH